MNYHTQDINEIIEKLHKVNLACVNSKPILYNIPSTAQCLGLKDCPKSEDFSITAFISMDTLPPEFKKLEKGYTLDTFSYEKVQQMSNFYKVKGIYFLKQQNLGNFLHFIN